MALLLRYVSRISLRIQREYPLSVELHAMLLYNLLKTIKIDSLKASSQDH